MDIFDNLHPGDIATVCLPRPINLYHPQHVASLQHRIYVQAYSQASHGADSCRFQLSGIVVVWDDTQSSTANSYTLKEL